MDRGQEPGGRSYNVVQPACARQPVLLQGWVQQSVAADLLKRAGYDYATVKRGARTAAFKPIDLKANFSADIPVTLARITSHNVLGKLTGSKYPDETVSFGTHWDNGLRRRRASDPAGQTRRRRRNNVRRGPLIFTEPHTTRRVAPHAGCPRRAGSSGGRWRCRRRPRRRRSMRWRRRAARSRPSRTSYRVR